jgi:hypothetical protein
MHCQCVDLHARRVKKKRGKAILVTGHEGPYICETSRHTRRVINLKFFNVHFTVKVYF